jgi:hypothetical protein
VLSEYWATLTALKGENLRETYVFPGQHDVAREKPELKKKKKFRKKSKGGIL